MKFWIHWPYWLRGGVIGGGVALVFLVLYFVCSVIFTEGFVCLVPLLASPFYPVADFIDTHSQFRVLTPFLSLIIFSLAVWFIAGSFVGLLVGYIKSKKKGSR